MQFKSFQSRLSVFFMALLVFVLGATYWVVQQKNIENAEERILTDLEITAEAFQELLDVRTQSLFDIVRPATSDFAFIKAFKTQHEPTVVSAMQNLTERIYNLRADVMLLIDPDGELIASTRSSITSEHWNDLIRKAEADEFSESSGIKLIDDQAYQLIVTPLFTPDPEAWIVLGFPIDEGFALDTRDITQRDISIVVNTAGKSNLLTSSLIAEPRKTLQKSLSQDKNLALSDSKSRIIQLGNERFVSLARDLSGQSSKSMAENRLSILLQGSLDEALKPYQRLNRVLLSLFGLGMLFALLATLGLSRSLSRPLKQLTKNVGLIDAGDYSVRTRFKRQDELNTLGESINRMAQGLQEKEQVRSLLGKVVSDEIATELLSKELELGGEEKEVTILFSDVRNFTAMCEGASPSAILDRLNRYFNAVSQEIEAQGGVVDKYIGDAIMALYGAPVHYENAAERAVNSAFSMLQALAAVNAEFIKEGVAQIGIGIGISTGKVVVGNMGSEQRLNYTAIGDDVNLASRLEGMTKAYGLQVIVSEATCEQVPQYHFRQVDTVRVKGKQEPVKVFTPVSIATQPQTQSQQDILIFHQQGLEAYQKREWEKSEELFRKILKIDGQDSLAQIYLKRCRNYRQQEPGQDWDGVYTLETK